MMKHSQGVRRLAQTSITLLLGTSGILTAQGASVDSRWMAWTGCWQPVDGPASQPTSSGISDIALSTLRTIPAAGMPTRSVNASLPLVCVVPGGAPSIVNVITIDSGKVVARDTIDASGQQVSMSREGCTGWRRADWSPDNRRVYLRSELDCVGGLHRLTTALLAISPAAEWLDIQGLRVSGNTAVRARRYRDVGIPSNLPADVANAVSGVVQGKQLAIGTARASVGAKVLSRDVIDATRQLDPAVVQAWLVERGQRFELDGKQLVALADAGVPGPVTDAMVALSYPEHFELQRAPVSSVYSEGPLTRMDSARIASEFLYSQCALGYDPFWYSSCGFGYSNLYSFGRYGLRYGYGYSPYGYGFGTGYYGGYNYYVPVIVDRTAPTESHGQVVKGRGYTRGSSSGTASSDGGGSRSSGSTGSSGGGSSPSSSGSTGSSTGSSSTGRTAHPRP
jgi:hypothetical protein